MRVQPPCTSGTVSPQPARAPLGRALGLTLLLAALAFPGLGAASAAKPAGGAKSAQASATSSKGAAKPKTSTGAPDPQTRRLCAALHALPEERRAQCCSKAASSSLAGECERALGAALRERSLRLDGVALDRCAADTAQELAGCDWVTTLLPPAPGTCRGVVQGARAEGARCRSSLECKDGLYCRPGAGKPGAANGLCAKPVAPGSACGAGMDTLATYLRSTDLTERHPECAGYCLAGRCNAFSALGGGCSSSKQCAPGQHCAQGKCAEGAWAALGAPCTGTSCGPGAFCQQGKCAALKVAGAACASPFECRGACLMPPGASAGTCGMKCSDWPLPPTQGEPGAAKLPAPMPPNGAGGSGGSGGQGGAQ